MWEQQTQNISNHFLFWHIFWYQKQTKKHENKQLKTNYIQCPFTLGPIFFSNCQTTVIPAKNPNQYHAPGFFFIIILFILFYFALYKRTFQTVLAKENVFLQNQKIMQNIAILRFCSKYYQSTNLQHYDHPNRQH